jgi:hypothetical protein
VLVAVEVKDAGDEVPVQHRIAGNEQSFKVFAIDLQFGEPRVVEQQRDQLPSYVTFRGQPAPILEPTGDPPRFVDDRYMGVGVDHPPEERRARPLTTHDKVVGVSTGPDYRLHCSLSRSGCFSPTTYVPPVVVPTLKVRFQGFSYQTYASLWRGHYPIESTKHRPC